MAVQIRVERKGKLFALVFRPGNSQPWRRTVKTFPLSFCQDIKEEWRKNPQELARVYRSIERGQKHVETIPDQPRIIVAEDIGVRIKLKPILGAMIPYARLLFRPDDYSPWRESVKIFPLGDAQQLLAKLEKENNLDEVWRIYYSDEHTRALPEVSDETLPAVIPWASR